MYVQNRSSVSSAKASIHHKLTKLEEIQRTSLIVRNDMTVEAQRRLYKRIIQQRNIKEIRLHNKHVAVIDKYTTALCQHTGIPKPRQPLPDYMHWYESSGELHYLTYEARKNLPEGPWDGMAGFLLPSTILNLPFVVISHPPNDILLLLSILAWVTLDEANIFERKMKILQNWRGTLY